MTAPDPAFVKFFERDFRRELEAVEIPGLAGASWDRKAAWLLWTARGNTSPPVSDLTTDNSHTEPRGIFS